MSTKRDVLAKIIVEKGFIEKTDFEKYGFEFSDYGFEEIAEGRYLPKSVKKYEGTGLNLLKSGNAIEAEPYLRACYVFNPSKLLYNMYAFYFDILKQNYENVPAYFEVFFKTESSALRRYYIFCLYLVSFVNNLPEPLKTMAKGIHEEDFMEEGKKLRKYVGGWDYKSAHDLAKDIYDKSEDIEDKIESLLVMNFAKYQVAFAKASITRMESEEGYLALVAQLYVKSQNHVLSPCEKRMHYILMDIRSMLQNRESLTMYGFIEDPQNKNLTLKNETFDDMIRYRNYHRAIDAIKSGKAPFKEHSRDGEIILKLLNKALELKNKLIYRELYPDDRANMSYLEKIENYLQKENYGEVEFYIEKYLKAQGDYDYKYLIDALISLNKEVGWIYGEFLIDILPELHRDLSIVLSKLTLLFESFLKDSNFQAAEVILNMIREGIERGHFVCDPNDFEALLTQYEQAKTKGNNIFSRIKSFFLKEKQ